MRALPRWPRPLRLGLALLSGFGFWLFWLAGAGHISPLIVFYGLVARSRSRVSRVR